MSEKHLSPYKVGLRTPQQSKQAHFPRFCQVIKMTEVTILLHIKLSNSLDLLDLSLQNLIMSNNTIRRRPNSQTSNLGWMNSTPTTTETKSLSILANEPYLYLPEIYTHYPRLSKNIKPTGYFMAKQQRTEFQPNTTQTPNFLFDLIMSECSDHPARFFVLCAIVRKTLGWHKNEDNLSMSQIMDLTGLSYKPVQAAIKYWASKKVIKILNKGNGRKTARYRILIYEYIQNRKHSSTGLTPVQSDTESSAESPSTPVQSDTESSAESPSTPPTKLNNKTNYTKLTIQKENTNATALQIIRDLQNIATQNNVTFDNSLNDKKYFNYLISDRAATNELILSIAQKLIDVKKYFRTEGFKYAPSWAQKPLSFKTIHTHFLEIQEYSIIGKSGLGEDWKSGRTRIV